MLLYGPKSELDPNIRNWLRLFCPLGRLFRILAAMAPVDMDCLADLEKLSMVDRELTVIHRLLPLCHEKIDWFTQALNHSIGQTFGCKLPFVAR